MQISFLKRLPDYLTRYIYMQLVLSIYSYLILVCWGLPFTPLSFFGNFIFNPVLTLFLGLAALLFFTELCYLPNQCIVYLLELLSSGWLFVLRLGATDKCNITCAKPPYLVITTIGIATLIIMAQRSSYRTKNLLLVLLATSSIWMMSSGQRENTLDDIPCGQGNLYALATNAELTIIEPGCLSRSPSAPDWIEYTLLPTITQRYGTHTIDHLIILQPGQRTFQAMQKLLEKMTVKHIYIPLWQGQASRSTLYHYMRMKEAASEQNTILHRLSTNESIVLKKINYSLELVPLDQTLTTSSITYCAFAAMGSIDKKTFTIYPAKYTRKTLK